MCAGEQSLVVERVLKIFVFLQAGLCNSHLLPLLTKKSLQVSLNLWRQHKEECVLQSVAKYPANDVVLPKSFQQLNVLLT